jgi:hypothetical protein
MTGRVKIFTASEGANPIFTKSTLAHRKIISSESKSRELMTAGKWLFEITPVNFPFLK